MESTDTHQVPRDNVPSSRNPLFWKLPEQYYAYAVQWCMYPRWTLEETANLLTGCVPHREMFLKGDSHRELDQEVLDTENRIRAALGSGLRIVESKKYFDRTYIDSSNVIDWAMGQAITLPEELLRAWRETRQQRDRHGYTTPCMQAIGWLVEKYWDQADLRAPPSQGELIKALLQEFPDLTPDECMMVEAVARHPVARAKDT